MKQERGRWMSVNKKLDKAYKNAKVVPFNNNSRIVLMSDCHRGDGSWNDSFAHNQTIFFAALGYYYDRGYTYIELGDGDELWENKEMKAIISVHDDVFYRMAKFYEECRFFTIYGNHDMVKKDKAFAVEELYSYYDEGKKEYICLFPDITVYESIILKDENSGEEIFLTHGHQGDFLNDTIWKVTRFLVRYVWRPLEALGVRDPTSPAKNHKKKGKVEERIIDWAKRNGQMIVVGHTHRPSFPDLGEVLYFNTGSCIHPICITAIEIYKGTISLVKWCTNVNQFQMLGIAREVLAGPESIKNFYQSLL